MADLPRRHHLERGGGATSDTYTITSVGFVRVRESATNLFGTGVTQSAALAVTVDTSLANLTVSQGTMTPAFSSTVFAYSVTVPHTVTTVSVTPTRTHTDTTLTVDGVPVTSGEPSGAIALAVGSTTVSVLATNTGVVTTTSVVMVRLPEPTPDTTSAAPMPPPPLPTPLTMPVATTPGPTPTTGPAVRPPATTIPVAAPPTTLPRPVPTPQGPLPEVQPGSALLITTGETLRLEAFVEGGTDFVTQLSDGSFGLRLSAQCGSNSCPLATGADGRAHVRAAPDGTVTIEGYGFRPSTLVHVWIFSTPRFLGSLGVASDGTFLGVLPLGATPEGEHTLQANGTRHDGIEQSVNLGLSIGVANPTDVRLPSTGPGRAHERAVAGLVVLCLGLSLLGWRRRWSARRG